MPTNDGESIREGGHVFIAPGGLAGREHSITDQLRATSVTRENKLKSAGVVRAIAKSNHWRWVSTPSEVRAS